MNNAGTPGAPKGKHKRHTAPPPPAAPALVQQKSDFTAEGSPPPGEVGNGLPPSVDEAGDSLAGTRRAGTAKPST